MIFNVYARESQKVNGINLVSCGHIFAKPGREIYRPKGREDWLLFFVAKESEIFYFNEEISVDEGSFLLFSPGENNIINIREIKPPNFITYILNAINFPIA